MPGRSSELMTATAFMQPSFFEILAMGINCLQNDNLTKLKVRGTAEARFAGRTIQQEVSSSGWGCWCDCALVWIRDGLNLHLHV